MLLCVFMYSQGTADAIRRCLWVLEEYPIVDFLVLPGYHLYKMDFQELLKVHCNNKADITVAVLSRRTDKDIELGTFQVNSENQVISFKDNLEIRVVRPFFLLLVLPIASFVPHYGLAENFIFRYKIQIFLKICLLVWISMLLTKMP